MLKKAILVVGGVIVLFFVIGLLNKPKTLDERIAAECGQYVNPQRQQQCKLEMLLKEANDQYNAKK